MDRICDRSCRFIYIFSLYLDDWKNPVRKYGTNVNETIGSRTIYKDEMPERGDIVIFYSDEEQETMVKRVIGLPGETITFVGGHVYVDGERLDESAYLEDSVVTEPGEQDEFVVPDGCIFVLGDNREVSYDARYWENPYISQDKIQSDVEVVIPFHKLPWF